MATSSSWAPNDQDDLTDLEKSPFQLLGTESMMTVLGLEPGFAAELHAVERKTTPAADMTPPRLRIVQQQAAMGALAAFSSHIHVWYPIIQPGFSERYVRTISGPLHPSPESCMILLVAATGFLALQDPTTGNIPTNSSHETYFDAALAALPIVLVDDGIDSVHCLVLLAIYHCCLSKPCHAHDYTLIAALKVQNLLLRTDNTSDDSEHVRRAYWAILLLESELCVHFDVTESGIWKHDAEVSLPNSRRAWQFDVDQGSPNTTITSPAGVTPLLGTSTDKTQCYFLAEVAMRRMLHRCNTAIRRTDTGNIVYAPGIANELELQLDEWYTYLPDMIRFDKHQDLDFDMLASPSLYPIIDPLCSFLRVQYYCCKISIYWPAVYQCIQQGHVDRPMLEGSRRFFDAYIQLMPSILISVRECVVNRWTLYASIFMTSMAAILAARTRSIRIHCSVDWTRLSRCLEATKTVDRRLIDASPSLTLLADRLASALTRAEVLQETP